MSNGSADDPRVVTYVTLRRLVGVLGVTFPVILAIGAAVIGGEGLQPTISHYIDTIMSGVFVGVLFAIGVFLYAYIGHVEPENDDLLITDNVAGNLACIFALGVALFPTTSANELVSAVHSAAATGMFLILAYFSLFLFTRTKPDQAPTKQKLQRNRWYRVFGTTILICILLIFTYNLAFDDPGLDELRPVFWLESIALWAFGWAWFIKGETLIRDSR